MQELVALSTRSRVCGPRVHRLHALVVRPARDESVLDLDWRCSWHWSSTVKLPCALALNTTSSPTSWEWTPDPQGDRADQPHEVRESNADVARTSSSTERDHFRGGLFFLSVSRVLEHDRHARAGPAVRRGVQRRGRRVPGPDPVDLCRLDVLEEFMRQGALLPHRTAARHRDAPGVPELDKQPRLVSPTIHSSDV